MVDTYVRKLFYFAVESRHTFGEPAWFVLVAFVAGGGRALLPPRDSRREGGMKK